MDRSRSEGSCRKICSYFRAFPEANHVQNLQTFKLSWCTELDFTDVTEYLSTLTYNLDLQLCEAVESLAVDNGFQVAADVVVDRLLEGLVLCQSSDAWRQYKA